MNFLEKLLTAARQHNSLLCVGLDPEAKRITAVIKDNTVKMGRLIDDLLAFSRMGRNEIIKTSINTGEMVKEMA